MPILVYFTVTNISHNYRAANNIIQVKGRQDNVNVGQHATTNYVSTRILFIMHSHFSKLHTLSKLHLEGLLI